jgi:translation elongation factor EF-G
MELNKLNLNELKTLLYLNKSDKAKSANKEIIKEIKELIKTKIKLSNIIIEDVSDVSEDKSEEIEDKTERSIYINTNSDESDESDESDKSEESNYRNDIKKMFNKTSKKENNNRFTQTSQRLFDRMFSEASYIDNIGRILPNNTITNINKFNLNNNDDGNNNVNKNLGKRKSIRK